MNPSVGDLLRDLARPEAWPGAAGVEIAQTHISAVFLAGNLALKLKKPLSLGFLDFSTRERRLQACEDETRLNSRLAPDVYLGVVAVLRDAAGRWTWARRPPGPEDEPAVLMRRLESGRTMRSMLERGELTPEHVRRVALRLARFHDEADASPEVQDSSRWEPLARGMRENLAQLEPFMNGIFEPALVERLRVEMERELLARRDLVEERAAAGMGRDGHGDLRLDHVYLPADATGEIVVVDCIEFRDDFRRGDPVGDVAFLVMELEHEHRADLAELLFGEWSRARRDEAGRALLPLHVAHRHAVRAKVRAIESTENEIAEPARRLAALRARGHLLAALASCAVPPRKPALVLTCGLPGAGKSTVARGLVHHAGFARISSDETRKSLAAWLAPASSWREGFDSGLYSPEWTEKTYRACREQAEALLLRGRRVVVDASFHEASRRASFLELARELHVPALIVECSAPDDEAVARLQSRKGDASDADASVRAAMSQRWEPASDAEFAHWRLLPTGTRPEEATSRALELLRAVRLA